MTIITNSIILCRFVMVISKSSWQQISTLSALPSVRRFWHIRLTRTICNEWLDKELNVLYRCLPSTKPTAGSQTTEDTATPVTQSFDFSALPLVTGATAQQGLIKARTGSATSTATKEAWFTAVNVPT